MQSVIRYRRLMVYAAFILTSAPLFAADPPPDLARRIAERELAAQQARAQYTYRQQVVIEEGGPRGGQYRETRDIIFSPTGDRTEQLVRAPSNTLKRLILTPEDFADIRDIQPLLITPELLPRYIVRFKGDEDVDGRDCWVLELTPRQLFHGFRMFDGLIWAEKGSLSIVRTYGRAVPELRTRTNENLFPRFTTLREPIDGEHWFPALTVADDLLDFRTGPVRMKLNIRYTQYKRFGAESTITFEDPPR
ncbi:MAG: hypothetical protein KJZ84_01620 [Bryobacteraceae bacterium]|nr:hypothetical protein [Bryobacteraceae bacterium]